MICRVCVYVYIYYIILLYTICLEVLWYQDPGWTTYMQHVRHVCPVNACVSVDICCVWRTFSNSLPPFGEVSAPAALQDFNTKLEKDIDTIIANSALDVSRMQMQSTNIGC